MTAKDVAWNLACRPSSPFFHRRQLVVVSNVSWGLLDWEADLIVCSKAGFLTEVEIKISFSNWKADLAKTKWNPNRFKRTRQMIKSFYYAAPEELAHRFAFVKTETLGPNGIIVSASLPEHAGIISVAPRRIEILRPATPVPGARKLTEAEQLKLARLGAIKAWRRYTDAKVPVELTEDGEMTEEKEILVLKP